MGIHGNLYYNGGITVRLADDSDAQALSRLAALESTSVPVGPTLLAERDGEALAALPIHGGSAIADPFRRTAAVVELLEFRAAQLRGEGIRSTGRLRDLLRTPRAMSLR
jgi:hypothetical protein